MLMGMFHVGKVFTASVGKLSEIDDVKSLKERTEE